MTYRNMLATVEAYVFNESVQGTKCIASHFSALNSVYFVSGCIAALVSTHNTTHVFSVRYENRTSNSCMSKCTLVFHFVHIEKLVVVDCWRRSRYKQRKQKCEPRTN